MLVNCWNSLLDQFIYNELNCYSIAVQLIINELIFLPLNGFFRTLRKIAKYKIVFLFVVDQADTSGLAALMTSEESAESSSINS